MQETLPNVPDIDIFDIGHYRAGRQGRRSVVPACLEMRLGRLLRYEDFELNGNPEYWGYMGTHAAKWRPVKPALRSGWRGGRCV
jgi:hypothetical protein